MEHTEVLVIGGGLSGLAVAWWLGRAGIAVEVWERHQEPGGLIATRRINGYAAERAASLMVNFNPAVTLLLEQTGLARKKIAVAPGAARYVVREGALVRVPMRLSGLLFGSLWSMRGRLRLLAEPWIPRGGHDDETVGAFVTRRLGREALEKAFEPFLACTFAADPERVNARAVLPRLTALEARHGSLALGILARKFRRPGTAPALETFSFRGGMEALVQALASAPGVYCRAEHTALCIERKGQGWHAVCRSPRGERSVHAHQLVLSVPAPEAATLLDPVDTALAEMVRGVEYAPLAVVHLGLDRSAVAHPLGGMGFLVPRAEGRELVGCQWVSSLFPERAPPGKVLLSAYLGGARAPEVLQWDDQRIIAATLYALKPLLGLTAAPEMVHLERHPRALPLYYGAYQKRVRAIGDRLLRLPGLHLVGNYLGGLSTRDRIICAQAAARRVQALLANPKVGVFCLRALQQASIIETEGGAAAVEC